MIHVKVSCLRCSFIFLLLCFFSFGSAQAQSAKQSDDAQTIQLLLNEVRALRKTLQRTILSSQRSQIIMERLKASNEQVVRLTRMLEDARNERDGMDRAIPRIKEQEKIIEKAIEQEIDPVKRSRYELELADTKRSGSFYKQRLEQLQEREQQLYTQLRAAQAKASELESRLDTLEREIEDEAERQQTEDKVPGNKRP